MLRVEIHLCYAPGCPRPPDFIVGGKRTPMCKGHYDLHSTVERAELEAWSSEHDRRLRGE